MALSVAQRAGSVCSVCVPTNLSIDNLQSDLRRVALAAFVAAVSSVRCVIMKLSSLRRTGIAAPWAMHPVARYGAYSSSALSFQYPCSSERRGGALFRCLRRSDR